jgi:hypothetical protein
LPIIRFIIHPLLIAAKARINIRIIRPDIILT